jgi:replicative DNA helicase
LYETREFENVIETEKVIVAAIISNNEDAKEEILQSLKISNFLSVDIAKIFHVAFDLYSEGVALDKNTISTKVNRKQQNLLNICKDIEFTPSSIKHIINEVVEQSKIRDMSDLADGIKRLTIDPETTYEGIMGELHVKMMGIVNNHSTTNVFTPADLLGGIIEGLESGKDEEDGVTYALESLDDRIGYMPKKGLVLIAARPSFGKTQLALQMCTENAREGKPTLFISLEMSEVQVVERLISRIARVPLFKIRKKTLNNKDINRIKDAKSEIINLPLYIVSSSILNVPELRSKARRIDIQNKGRLSLVVVDYMQLMTSSGSEGTRNEVVSSFSRGMKQIAMDMNIPVVGLSQLSRASEQREDKIPVLSDLRDSGSLEQDADVVVFLYKKGYYTHKKEDENDLSIIIAKNRHGPVGTVRVYNDPMFQDIRDLES